MSDLDETKVEGNVELDMKRKNKLTTKALEKKLDDKMNLRKRVLARLVSKKEEIENLMKNDSNALLVEKDHLSYYSKFLNDFTEMELVCSYQTMKGKLTSSIGVSQILHCMITF